jgi:hypothetical protein
MRLEGVWGWRWSGGRGVTSATGSQRAVARTGGGGLPEPDTEEVGGGVVSESEMGNSEPRGRRMLPQQHDGSHLSATH